jgi:hypothetical protein
MENNEINPNNINDSIPDDSLNAPNIPNNSNIINNNNIIHMNLINNNFINQLNPILNNIVNTNRQNIIMNNIPNPIINVEENNNIQNLNLLESANNSLNILNRITNELSTIQARLQEHNNQIHRMNNLNTINNIINNNNNNNIDVDNNSINDILGNLGEFRNPNLNRNQNTNQRQININILNRILSDFPFQDQFFIFSLALAILIICWLILKNMNIEFTFPYLESEEMYLNYLLINIIFFIFSWDFFLFLQNFIFHSSPERREENKASLKLKEIILFSPFWMYCTIKYSVPNYLSTIFDGFFIVFVSIQYKVNFIFSIRLYKYINNKITNISNLYLDENKGLMRKMRIHFMLIILYNLIFISFLFLVLEDSDFLYKLILLNKVNNNSILLFYFLYNFL